MRLALRFVVCLQDALHFCFVLCFDAGLFAGGFAIESSSTPRLPGPTPLLTFLLTVQDDFNACSGRAPASIFKFHSKAAVNINGVA